MNEHNTASGAAARFTKKPVTIEAIQWTGRNLREIIAFTNGPPDTRTTHAGMAWDAYTDLVERDGLKISTLEGKMLASPGDWIIKGVKGEFYPCKPDIFEATYSRAALASAPAPKKNQCGEVCERAKLCAICARGLEDTTAPAEALEDTDAVALDRYKVVPAHNSMFHRFAVVAGDGKQQLYLGRETECQNMARKFAGAFLDGAFYQAHASQQAPSMLEDAAASEVLMEHSGCGSGTQVDMLTVRLNPGDKVIMLKGRITQATDAARKQGGQHGTE